jgi:hypothetical protein
VPYGSTDRRAHGVDDLNGGTISPQRTPDRNFLFVAAATNFDMTGRAKIVSRLFESPTRVAI